MHHKMMIRFDLGVRSSTLPNGETVICGGGGGNFGKARTDAGHRDEQVCNYRNGQGGTDGRKERAMERN